MIYSNVLDSERPIAFYQAKQDIDEIFLNTKNTGAFISKNFEFETYDIQQKVDFYKGNERLFQIDYTVVSNDKQIWSESHLVANTEHAE